MTCCGDGPDDYCADCPERIGNDGLTDAQRAESARRYRETVCAPLTPEEASAIREWRARKRREQ